MNRRIILKSLAGLTGGGAITGLYTWKIEPYWLEFVHLDMPIYNLPSQLAGKTLMQISDIHVGNRFDNDYLARSMKRATRLQPDFVVYTGDYVSYENEEQFNQLREVMKDCTKGKIGTIGILGNHDYGHHWSQNHVADEIQNILEQSGVEILRDQSKNMSGLMIIGLDDYYSPKYEAKTILSTVNPENANLVLCHNPDVCDEDVWSGYKGWILSGHTHGGQCKPPFLPPPILPVKNKNYSAGKIDLDDGRILYINRALGCLWPVRFNMRPEITVFKLLKA